VSAAAGIHKATGSGLGVVALDVDADGWLDLYVTNDADSNLLWRNKGDGTFSEEALFSGCAVNGEGTPEAGMGVTAGDFDNDGDEDLMLGHMTAETHTLYINQGGGLFEDRSIPLGLAGPTVAITGFGIGWIDYDNNGWLDLLVVNGAMMTLPALLAVGDPYPLHEPNQLFRNHGGRRLEDVSATAGEPFRVSEVSRGAAFGDIDNDGDTDVVVANNTGPTRLLLNQVGADTPWLGVVPVAGASVHPVTGTWARLERADARPQWRRSRSDGSYASANDPRILFGLGVGGLATTLTLTWPDGSSESWSGLASNRYHVLKKGSGKKVGQQPQTDRQP
jgi:hypothetical protein